MKKNKKLNISWRILCVLMLICLIIPFYPTLSFAADDAAGVGIEWSLDGDVLTISGKGEMRDFTENDTPPWYKQKDKIRAVIIESGITTVGDLAFYKHDNLISVTLADSVKEIGAYAFSDCASIKMIDLGSGIENIGKSAFARCSSLVNLRIPSSVKVIDDKAFYRCSALTSIYIPDSVTTLGNMIFTYCDSLIGVSVQANVTTLPEWMFYSCTNLSEVVLSSSIKTAEDRAFYGCESFTSLYYPSEDKSELVESIKNTSISTFAEENVRSDMPTDNNLEGAESKFEDNKLSYTEIKIAENKGSIITTKVTEVSIFENNAFSDPTASVEIDALIDSDEGWNDLVTKIQDVIDDGLAGKGSIYVFVDLQIGNNIPKDVLSDLSGKKVQTSIRFKDGSVFGLDCERIDKNTITSSGSDFGCEVKEKAELSEKYKDTLDGAQTYEVKYNHDIDMNFSSSIFVGKENAYSVATIYKVNGDKDPERLQSAVVDKDGNATFYLGSVSSNTDLVVGVGVTGETIENAVIPDSVAVDRYGLLDRYRPIDYAVTEERKFMGMNSWQYALAVLGVVGGIVIAVSVVAVMIYRKKRLALIYKMKNTKY